MSSAEEDTSRDADHEIKDVQECGEMKKIEGGEYKTNESPKHQSHAEKGGNRDRIATERITTSVDRENVCPFLIRVFYAKNGLSDSTVVRRLLSYPEYYLHSWKSMTLREMASLLASRIPEAKAQNAKIKFCSVFCETDQPLRHRLRQMGTVYNYEMSPDDDKSLESFRFSVGDGMLITISTDQTREGPRRGGAAEGSGHRYGIYSRPHKQQRGGEGFGKPQERRWGTYPSYKSTRTWRPSSRHAGQDGRGHRHFEE